jgi:hypothetical protein
MTIGSGPVPVTPIKTQIGERLQVWIVLLVEEVFHVEQDLPFLVRQPDLQFDHGVLGIGDVVPGRTTAPL